MKKCIKCSVEKPLSEFYAHSKMADGTLNKCKDCTKDDVAAHRLVNIEKIRAYDRQRGQSPERKARARAYYRKKRADPEFMERQKRRNKSWAEKNTIKRAAHIIAGNAKRDGKLTPPDECSRCGGGDKLNAHHEDYTKPLEVVWLCGACHGLRHQEINEAIRNGEDWSDRGF